jgi:hypothetical protein
LLGADGALIPALFVAVTVKVSAAPATRFGNTALPRDAVTVPPPLLVTV